MNKTVKSILIIISFLLVLVISELIYLLNNQESLQITDYLNRAQTFTKLPFPQITLNNFVKASSFNLQNIAQEYPQANINPNIKTPPLPFLNPRFNYEINQYLKSIPYLDLSNTSDALWGQHFYHLGLIAHRHNQSDLLLFLWQTAIHLAPEWGYFHTELTNYYLAQNKLELASNQIDYCLQFEHAKEGCLEYQQQNLDLNSPENIGYLEQIIKDDVY